MRTKRSIVISKNPKTNLTGTYVCETDITSEYGPIQYIFGEKTKPVNGTLDKVGIYCAQDNPSIIAAFLTNKNNESDTIEYRWLSCEESDPTAWFVVSDWTKDNYYLSWTPEKSGNYIIVAQARIVESEDDTLVFDSFGVNFRTLNAKIKDICQMPYEGGYLIGIESLLRNII